MLTYVVGPISSKEVWQYDTHPGLIGEKTLKPDVAVGHTQ